MGAFEGETTFMHFHVSVEVPSRLAADFTSSDNKVIKSAAHGRVAARVAEQIRKRNYDVEVA